MGAEVIADNSNTRGCLFDKNNCRTLDVFYTNYDTKLYVKDGTLIEEKIVRSEPSTDEIPSSMMVGSKPSTEIPSSDDDDEMSARLSENYLSTSPPESPGPTPEEAMDHSQTIRSAKLALEYYNKKHHTQYELKNPVLSNGCVWRSGLWIHANFTASESSKKSPRDSSTKLFFAELAIVGFKAGVEKYSVTACRPLNGTKRTTSCEMCGGDIEHPTSRIRQGRYETKPRDLRPRRNGRAI